MCCIHAQEAESKDNMLLHRLGSQPGNDATHSEWVLIRRILIGESGGLSPRRL